MSQIRVLKEEISNRIAAGEVIERPASVVKELVDNAIDAGATRIFIHIEKAGNRLIQVTDNGSGMDEDDALMCLEAHATSKIHDVEDLEKISTFGFRGEAIPSVASVSRFEINTRRQESIEGTKVICEGGTIKTVESTGCPPGTTMSVRNLFFNVPARKKFLRSAATEEAHIQETVLLLTLSRLDIFIELRFDGRVILSIPQAEDIRTRASLLFGREMLKEMLPVNYAEAGIMVTGLTARPGMTRKTRKEQRLFVNGRPIDAVSIYNGVKEAYLGMVVKGRHAPCLLYFVMNPARMDINVHPAKREVRFKENFLLGQITTAAVSQALRGLTGSTIQVTAPSFMETQTTPTENETDEPQVIPSPRHPLPVEPMTIMPVPDISKVTKPVFSIPESTPLPETTPETRAILPEPIEREAQSPCAEPQTARSEFTADDSFERLNILGQYKGRYLLAQNESGLVLFSIRAARERILFEKMITQIKNSDAASQLLLLPVTIDLSPADTRLVNKYIDKIKAVGFEVDPFGGNTFVIAAVPAAFPDENIIGVFYDIIDQLRENPAELRKHADNFILQIMSRSALKGAVKPLAPEEIKHLIKELSSCQMPYSCPAGKPVLIHFSENELLRRFGKKD